MAIHSKQIMIALAIGATTLTGLASTPVAAQPGQERRDWRDDRRDDRRDARRDVRSDKRDDRRDDRRAYRQPRGVVYNYDWNRPERRYGSVYRPERYYRTGYAPVPVTRSTRIYRGGNDRYYCRRSDGTTGLIVGAAVGGLLGNQLARGQSNTIGTLLGAGAGALLGREVDRGGIDCR